METLDYHVGQILGSIDRSGSTNDTPVIGYDLLPTLADIARDQDEVRLPKDLDGMSLTPTLGLVPGESREQRRTKPLLWHFPYCHPERDYSNALSTIGVNDFAVSQTQPMSAIRFTEATSYARAESKKSAIRNAAFVSPVNPPL